MIDPDEKSAMNDQDQTNQDLLEELARLRRRVAEQEAQLARSRQAEADQRQINDSLPVLVATAGLDGCYKEVNAAFERILGWSEQESLSRPFMEFIHPDDRVAAVESFERLKSGEALAQFIDRNLCKDGSYRWISWVVIPLLERGIVFGIGQDITEKKLAESELQEARAELEQRVKDRTKELQRSESRHKALVESSPDAILMLDLEGRIIFASPQAAERHEADEANDLIGRSVMDLVVESDRELLKSNIQRLLKSEIRRDDQYTGLRTDGTTFIGEVSSSVINGASGEPEALMAVYRDITEHKEAQDALQKEQDSLRRMLRASDRDRKLIAYEIHDGIAQQLLGALLQFEAVLQVDHALAEDAGVPFDIGLAALRQASAEARSLINRTRTPVLEEFGVAAAIAEFIDQFNKMPDRPEITYSCNAQFERLDPVLESTIFRVVQEAVTNACIHSKSETVRVTLSHEGGNVIIDVQDSGIGFDLACVRKNRFGLHSIRERTRLLGKDLRIESTPGQGTRIRAIFPVVDGDMQAD
jgi:PAS domain S-box-containing protein